MKGKLKAIIKNSSLIYSIYYFLGSLILRILGAFVRTDKNLVLFVSYGGKKYDDSPRVVYEYLLKNPVSPEHKYVWAFTEPEHYPGVCHKVKIDTLEYYVTALKAGYWITNSSASRGLNFKKLATKNILFEHGMVAMKKVGADMEVKTGIHNKHFVEHFDAIFIEGKNEADILTHAMGQARRVFVPTGLPRNDNLLNVEADKVRETKEKFNIPLDKKVILYAPTFRDQNLDSDRTNYLVIPFDFTTLEEKLGQEYVVLITAHYEVAKYLDQIPKNNFVYNAFGYPEVNDLLIIADILVSDYSSIVFDYSILGRPILCFGYDYDEFLNQRGVYTDLETLFSHGVIRTQEELVSVIQNMDYQEECCFSQKQIRDKYLAAYGNAAEKAVGVIFNELN